MNTAHKTALLCFLVAGCAVQLSDELDMTNFAKSPDTVNVTGAPGVTTCDMTIPAGTGGAGGAGSDPNVVKYAACSFKSPDGRKQGCLATSAVGDVWSCDVTIPADSEGSASPGTTWTIEYVFAESEDGAKLFATGAEIEADQLDGEVDLKVISDAADTTPPTITAFDPVSVTVYPGSPIQCRVLTDEDPVDVIGCTFLPDDASASVSCISTSENNTCNATIPAGVTPGVIYNEVNHFARDKALNITIGDDSQTFTVISPPTTGRIDVDMALLDPACAGASWSIATSPGGTFVQAGAGSIGGIDVAPGDYAITWDDTALACTVPTISPETKAVTLGGTTTFDLSTDYTTRSTFAVNTDVGLDGNYGAAPPGGGAWTVASDYLPAQFAAAGTGDVAGITPSLGDFYTGRAYTLNWTPEADHTTPSPNAITTSGAYQGNYVFSAGGACESYTADETIGGTGGVDWFESTVQTSSDTQLIWTVYASVDAASGDSGFGLMSGAGIPDYSDLVARVRFSESNTVESFNQGSFECDDGLGDTTCPTYQPDTIYKFVFDVDIIGNTFDLDFYDPCDGTADRIAEDFPLSTSVSSLDRWGGWESYANTLSFNTSSGDADWDIPACVPTETCITEGYDCGAPLDDCGDPLSCGTCSGPDVCFPEGTCCTPSATVCTDPNPDYECGDWSDGCGDTVNCDTGGQTCDERVSGETCNVSGQCVSGGTLGDPYVYVTPADVGFVIGLGVTAPVPTVACSFSNPITVNGTTVENCTYTGGCVGVSADNVTFRNVDFLLNDDNASCPGVGGVGHGFALDGTDGFTFTHSKLSSNASTGDKGFFIRFNNSNIAIEYSDLSGYQDLIHMGFNEGPTNNVTVQYNWMHDLAVFSGDPHYDMWQSVHAYNTNNDNWVWRGCYVGPIGGRVEKLNAHWNAGEGYERVIIENNYFEPMGYFGPRHYATGPTSAGSDFVMRNNVYSQSHKTILPDGTGDNGYFSHAVQYTASDSNGVYRCNRYEDGDFIESQYILNSGSGTLTHDTTGCPSYPP